MRGILCPSGPRGAAGTSRVTRVHRTTTAATLAVTVALSALTGCVTVQRPAAPGPAAPSQSPLARSDGRTGPQIVQAPAREALEMVGPSRRPTKGPASLSPRGNPATPAPRGTAPADDRPQQRPRATPRPDRTPHRPPVDLSGIPEQARRDLRSTPDICGLGKRYGGWRADSPETVICRNAYGR
ncbi:hypothetical protein GCM10009535_12770 [Streptomyces thermocarboxydovorans]|uniref:Lipoprotein n=1 Tax=Streptomyces thermocarboxydovorans TaxID=59298 RepID=A0ABP3SKH3_9ACTN